MYIDICKQEHKNYRMSYKNYNLNLKSTVVSHNHVTTENCTRLENNDVTTNKSYMSGKRQHQHDQHMLQSVHQHDTTNQAQTPHQPRHQPINYRLHVWWPTHVVECASAWCNQSQHDTTQTNADISRVVSEHDRSSRLVYISVQVVQSNLVWPTRIV